MFDEDLSALSKDELEEELAAQAAHIDAGLSRLLALAVECERRLSVGGDGVTFAQWLASRCSLLPRQAREHERIGKRLTELPLIQSAFARGELSYGKVSVLTRIAEPETEERLVELAEVMTASQLQRAIGTYRRLSRAEAAGQQEREFLHYQWEGDGSLAMRARLAAEDGALVLKALDAGREALWERRRVEDVDERTVVESARPSGAEALVAMADLALAGTGREHGGGDRYQVVVHVDAQTLANDVEGRCELDVGGRLAAETARRLTCDGSIVELLERNGQPLALGRKRRTLSPALRRALAARDRGCRFPGCTNTRFVDGHHIEHWGDGGETNLDNLISLCRRHHRYVHEQGYTIEFDDDGEAHFRNQYGVALPNVPRSPPSDARALPDQHRRFGHAIDARTCWTGTGDRMNLGLAVDAFIAISG